MRSTPPAAAAQRAVRADDAVAGPHDQERVRTDRGTQGLDAPAGHAEPLGECAVRGRRAVRDVLHGAPHPPLEFRAAGGELDVELGEFTGEVRGQLPGDAREPVGCVPPVGARRGAFFWPGTDSDVSVVPSRVSSPTSRSSPNGLVMVV